MLALISARSVFRLLVLLLCFAVPCAANAIIIRDDVADANYHVATSEFPALVDLPGEGHGILIAPRWVLTAAHAVSWQMSITDVTLNGTKRAVSRVVKYPGYQPLPRRLIDQVMASGNPTPALVFLASSNDVALIELVTPVQDVAPATLFQGGEKQGQIVEIIGKGATGTGLTGMSSDAPHRTELRRAFSTITGIEDRWLSYTFAKPPNALPLQGTSGSGDSGGPVLIDVGGQKQVAGLASWQFVQRDPKAFRVGKYGQIAYNVRVSHYLAWIKGIIAP